MTRLTLRPPVSAPKGGVMPPDRPQVFPALTRYYQDLWWSACREATERTASPIFRFDPGLASVYRDVCQHQYSINHLACGQGIARGAWKRRPR